MTFLMKSSKIPWELHPKTGEIYHYLCVFLQRTIENQVAGFGTFVELDPTCEIAAEIILTFKISLAHLSLMHD
jgi:lipoprotein NlpI